jgi:tetratricopeptide (TPR) repeat protein
MKKILMALILALSFSTQSFSECQSANTKIGIKKYKAGNYTGAMQTLQKVTANDPGNALAHYYLAMCFVRIGNTARASSEYDSVISLSPNSELAKNAAAGKAYLTPNAPIPVVNTKKDGFLSDKAKEKIDENSLKNIIETVNKNKKPDPAVLHKLDNFENKHKSSNDTPTKEEVAEAIQTLSKAGLNTANLYNTAAPQSPQPNMIRNMASQINPELMQMNMLMGAFGNNNSNNNNMMNMMGGGGNSMNNMLPMLMMMQGQNGQNGQSIDPQTMQSMLSTMMMPNMMDLYGSNNNNGN